MPTNPRYKNGNFRRKMRARFRAMNAPCHICNGKLGPILYDAKPGTPLAFVIDEGIPVSRWKEFNYPSPEAVAMDVENLFAAHFICNARKGKKLLVEMGDKKQKSFVIDGRW